MKYKVGDKVRVRTDLVVDKTYGDNDVFFRSGMVYYEGRAVTISEVGDYFYKIKEDSPYHWSWVDEMFEDVSDDGNKTQTVDKARTVDVGYYLKTYGHRVIKNVYQGVDNGKLFFTTVDNMNQYTLPKEAIEWVVPHEKK